MNFLFLVFLQFAFQNLSLNDIDSNLYNHSTENNRILIVSDSDEQTCSDQELQEL